MIETIKNERVVLYNQYQYQITIMQAYVPTLSTLVERENVNVIEFYCSPEYLTDIRAVHTIDLRWGKPAESFFLENPQEEVHYYHRDMCYIFDTKNDAQRGYRKILQNEMCYRNFYVVAFQEETIPSHRFPSTQDISCCTRVLRYTHRINNRMSWIYEKNEDGNWTTYLRYNHAPNVEMDTMQKDLERTLIRMPKPPQKGKQPMKK